MLFYKISFFAAALMVQSRFLILASLLCPFTFFYSYFKIGQPLWLIGENEGKCLRDNGYFFYKFCRKNYPGKPIYFVTGKESIDLDPFLKEDSNIIIFGSITHVFFFLLSTTLIYSHAQSDVGYIQLVKLFKRNCTRVFLQHGIIAFKQIHSTYRKNHNEMDVFIVSSDYEKNIISKNFDININTLKITGLARYDTLLTKPFPLQKSILYMPTWRNWAFSKKGRQNYIIGLEGLLNNKHLTYLLQKYDIDFNFYIHDKMQCCLNKINVSPQINMINSTKEILQDALKKYSMLITDYSSVAWDFYYLGKPVLFYQFDQEEYLEKKGSYIDFNSELFGELFLESDSLVAGIEKYILNNFAELPEYAENRNKYFKYRDTNNCNRIFQTIITSQ